VSARRLPRRLARAAAWSLGCGLLAEAVLQLARPALLDAVRQRTFLVEPRHADWPTLQPANFDPGTRLPLLVHDAQALWVQAPGRSGAFFLTPHVRTDDLGLRGPPLAPRAGADEVRLLFLGDSVTFGMRVEEHERFSDRLVEALGAQCPGTRFTAVNAGVVGYAAAQVLARLPGLLDATRPDAVLFSSGLNDCQLRPASDAQLLALATSAGARVRGGLRHSQVACGVEAGWAWLRREAHRLSTGSRLPVANWLHYPRYPAGAAEEPRTSEPEFLALLERIERLCRERGTPLVLVTQYTSPAVPSERRMDAGYFERLDRLTASLRAWGAEHDVPVADARSALQACGRDPRELLLDFCHPSPAGHALVAQELLRTLAGAGLPGRWTQRAAGG
jgi:lysophospholipase L1-like esterase